MSHIDASDRIALMDAVHCLEHLSAGARVAHLAGAPIEKLVAMLPAKASETISAAARRAIHGALKLSLKTLPVHDPRGGVPPPAASNWWHKAAGAASGAVGGAFGLAALAVELPVSTTIMMRSIADVARGEGADLEDLQVQLECVMVLGLGTRAKGDDAAEIGYFAAREAMSRAVGSAASHIAKHGLAREGAPALVRLISIIGERYSVNISEKVAAQLVPIAGAVGGAAINTVFIDHFQDVARGHFTVRRLERKYGREVVQAEYRDMVLQGR
jgi:hypothetical protein